jgi:hypothetical protein
MPPKHWSYVNGAKGSVTQGKPLPPRKDFQSANVLARLSPLANIQGVDLEKALHNKHFINGGPQGHK